MKPITFAEEMIQIDAAVVAEGLHLLPETLRAGLRDGTVTRTVEQGEGEDAGRFRVTFYGPARRLRLVFTGDGAILQSSSAAYSRPPQRVASPSDPVS